MFEKLILSPVKLFLGEDTPARRRLTRIKLTIFSSFVARGLSILITLVSVPLTLNYLGAERYGVWLTINSITGLFAFADLGIGNGLMNVMSEAFGKGDFAKARQYIASAFVTLTSIAVGIGILFLAVHPFVPWASVLNIRSAVATAEVGTSVLILVLCFLVGIPLGIVQRVQMGFQEGYVNQAWGIVGRLLALGALLIVIARQGGLPYLVLALVGTPLIVSLGNTVHLFFFRHPNLLPKFSDASLQFGRQLLQTGFLFFVLQLVGIVAYSTDTLVLARMIGPQAVAEYGVSAQLFGFSTMLISMGLSPLWPAYTEALAIGDGRWVRRVFLRTTLLSFAVAAPVSFFLLIFGHTLLRLWIGTEIVPATSVMVAMAVWQTLISVSGNFAMLLNGANVVTFQIMCAIPMAIANLLLSIFLVSRIGVAGAVWGSILAQVIFILIPSSIYVWRFMRTLKAAEA